MSKQNELELFKATMLHEKHEHFLYYASFTDDLERRIRERINLQGNQNLREYFEMFEPVSVGSVLTKTWTPGEKPDLLETYYKDIRIPEGSYINQNGVLRARGSMYHFTHIISPLRNARIMKELEEYPSYPKAPDYDIEDLKEKVINAHAQNKVTACSLVHLYEEAWQIRGYEPFLIDMMTNPDMCDFILDRVQEKNIGLAVKAAKAGVDMLFTGDDIANQNTLMFAPELWRKFIKSRWAKVYEVAKKIKPDIKIRYHSDGNIMSVIPELIEIGVDILNPLQPECIDVLEVKKKYGKQIVIDGTIGTQSTMPFGTPDEVRKVIRQNKEKLGYDGALILAPTHVLEPEVPIDNIIALIETCRE